MSDLRKNVVPINIQELFLPLSCVHSYSTRPSTSQNFYIKKIESRNEKSSFSRLGAKLWNEIPTKLRTLSEHKFKFNIRASLLNILETDDTYFVIPTYKNGELMFCFLFLLRVLDASFSYVFLRKIIIFAIS